MNRGIYATATGMAATQKMMDVIANNLANVSTNGFKRDELAFSDTLEKQLYTSGQPVGSLGCGPNRIEQFTIFGELGSFQATSNPLDVAITTPDAVFAVQGEDGQTFYTRDGSFTRNADGLLVTQQGLPVLDESGGNITLGEGQPEISENGTVSVNGNEVGKLGLFKGTFTKVGGNLFASENAQPYTEATVKSRTLEGSNVNAIETMVQMIQLNRLFELSQKSINQQDDLTQRLIQSLQDR